MESSDFETALVLGDFERALPLLEDMTSEEWLQLTLPHDLTPLHYACQHDRVDVAKLLVNNYEYSIERRDVNGCTPLHTAAQYGQLEVFKYLLQILFTNGGTHLQLKVDGKLCHTLMSVYQQTLSERHRDLSGNTPLHTASKHGSVDIVQLLIQEIGCDPQDRNKKGMSCLNLAAQYGCLPLVTYLTTQHCDLFGKSSTAFSLVLATESGHLDVVRFFIEELQCDSNSKDTQEMTLLHHASKHGHLNTVKYLVETQKCDPLCLDENLDTPLHVAALSGHLEVVKYFTMDQHCDPLLINSNNNTPLHLAALEGRLMMVRFLIEDLNCDPNSKGRWQRNPLHHASENARLDIIKYLIETHKCDPESQDENGISPLHIAAALGHLELVRYYILDCHCNPLVVTHHNNTPLHISALKGKLDVVEFFINISNCYPNCEGEKGKTPLHLAITSGHHHVSKFLIFQKHCNVLSPDSDGVTPFLLAVRKRYSEIVLQMVHTHRIDPYTQPDKKALLSAARDSGMLEYFTNYVDPLHQAAINGDMDTVRHYIERVQWSPLVKDRQGNNLLHTAAKHGQLEVVQFLTVLKHDCSNAAEDSNKCSEPNAFIRSGGIHLAMHCTCEKHCDPKVVNIDSNTALHLAALEGRLDVVKFLVEDLKCDPNSRGRLQRTPLHNASENGHIRIIKYLVEMQCCDLLSQDEDGNTSLHIAASYGQLEVVLYYTTETEHCCDPLIQNIHGNTPLHFSARYGVLDIVEFFVSTLLCDPNCENVLKKTPLHYALENGKLLVSKFLVSQKHCDTMSPDSHGVTPFLLAVRKGYLEIVKQMMHTHRIDPYTQPDKRALLSAARDSGMLEYFTNYVDPLHQATINGNMDTVRHYIESMQWSPLVKDRHGNNLLHTAAKHGQLEVVKYLTTECSQRADIDAKNKEGLTAQQIAANRGFMHVESYLRQACSSTHPTVQHLALPPSVNILVMGNSGSGKSTLVKALSQGKSILGRLTQVKGVQPLTAGIIPTTISSQDFGKVNIYDFAGHEEYYASHEMILHQTTQPLVLIAVNISRSMADIEKRLCYWLSILSNAKNDHAMHVLVIGSHADKTSNACIQKVEEKASLLAGNEGGIIYHGFVHFDCRYSVSNGMSQLRHMLSEICTSIRLSLSYSDTSFSNRMCTSLMHYLDGSSPTIAITIDQLQQKLKSSESPSPNLERLTDKELLVQTCESLSANGHLIFLSHDTDVGKSLLLTDEKIILSKVHACLGKIGQSINSLGILEEQQLKEILTSSLKDTMDPSLAVKYLHISQFCTRVTLDQLTSVQHDINHDTYYFFPNLVLAERPAQLWTSAEEDKYTHLYTWCLRCSNARHFFTPRYLHTLFIQLIKCDVTGNAKYTIWKNGILLVHGNGTRCVIEVTHQVTQLSLVMQCLKSKGHEIQLAKQRSSLISLIKSLKSKVCPKLELTEFLLLSDHTSDAAIEIRVSEVARSVVAGLLSVPYCENGDRTLPKHATISELLCFESFHFISSPQILQDIFRKCHSCYPVSEDTMASLSKSCGELVEKFCLESGCSVEDITYRQLYTELAKYSIFTDEDIYALAGIECFKIKSEQEPDNSLMEQDMTQFSSSLELVDLYEVNVQLVSVAKWKEFGLALGLSRATLEKIGADYHSVEQCLTEVLAALLKGQDRPHNSPLNWREVIDTLNSPTLNMRDCAKTLVQKLMRDKDNGVLTARDDVDNGVLDSHFLMEVKMSLVSLKHKWFHLGLSLGLSYYTLKIIEQSPSEDCLTEVLVKWLDQADMTLTRGPPSWRSLVAVLDCPLVQEHDVARNIKKDHPMYLISQ